VKFFSFLDREGRTTNQVAAAGCSKYRSNEFCSTGYLSFLLHSSVNCKTTKNTSVKPAAMDRVGEQKGFSGLRRKSGIK
jgi:hypothetical protein